MDFTKPAGLIKDTLKAGLPALPKKNEKEIWRKADEANKKPGRHIREELNKCGVKTWNDLPIQRQVEIMKGVCKPFSQALLPFSKNVERWDMLMMSLLVVTSAVTPFEVAFLESQVGILFFINCAMDVCFITDMIMQFWMAYRDDLGKQGRGAWVMDLRLIRARYLKSWFIVDLISILPFDGLGHILKAQASNSQSGSTLSSMRIIRLVRMARLLKLARLFRCSRIFEHLFSRIEIKYTRVEMVKWTVALTFLSHLFACMMTMVGTFSEDEFGTSWIVAVEMSKGHQGRSSLSLYNMALYWSLMTITSIGYGDITPQTNMEYATVSLLMLIGSCLWAHVIGSLCASISNLDMERMQHEQRMDAVLMMSKDRLLPRELRMRLRRFFQQSRRMHRMSMHSQITGLMSPALRGEVALHVTLKYLNKIDFLRGAEQTFILQLAKTLQIHFFPPNEKVVPEIHHDKAEKGFETDPRAMYKNKYGKSYKGIDAYDHGNTKESEESETEGVGKWSGHREESPPMTILERGIASRNGILSAGSVWHEDTIMVGMPALREAQTALSLTFVSVYTVTRDEFFSMLSKGSFPNATRALRKASWRLVLTRMLQRAAEEAKKTPEENFSLSEIITKLLDKISIPKQAESSEMQKLADSVSDRIASRLGGDGASLGGSWGKPIEGEVLNVAFRSGNFMSRQGSPDTDDAQGLQKHLANLHYEMVSARQERECAAQERSEIRQLLLQVLNQKSGSKSECEPKAWDGGDIPASALRQIANREEPSPFCRSCLPVTCFSNSQRHLRRV